MKIILKNQQANAIIETEDANIEEVLDMFVGALIQEGFPIGVIKRGLEDRVKEFNSISEEQ